jgi:hypothetical protein
MGSDGVVIDPPGFDDPVRLRERAEAMFVETFASSTIEGLDKGVLHRLAGRDVMPFDAGLLDPSQYGGTCQLS